MFIINDIQIKKKICTSGCLHNEHYFMLYSKRGTTFFLRTVGKKSDLLTFKRKLLHWFENKTKQNDVVSHNNVIVTVNKNILV